MNRICWTEGLRQDVHHGNAMGRDSSPTQQAAKSDRSGARDPRLDMRVHAPHEVALKRRCPQCEREYTRGRAQDVRREQLHCRRSQ